LCPQVSITSLESLLLMLSTTLPADRVAVKGTYEFSMPLDPALLELMPDEITIEPFVSTTVTQAHVYGAAVTFSAQVTKEFERVIDRNGRDLKSTARALIPDRVLDIDPRSRITLPTGWTPNQPPIMVVRPVGGVASIGLDSTEILF